MKNHYGFTIFNANVLSTVHLAVWVSDCVIGLIVVAVIGLALFKKSAMVCVDCRLFTNFVATKQVVLGFNFLTGLLIAIWRTEN